MTYVPSQLQSDHVPVMLPKTSCETMLILFFIMNLLSFSLHIIQILRPLFVYKRPSDLEARSGKSHRYLLLIISSIGHSESRILEQIVQ